MMAAYTLMPTGGYRRESDGALIPEYAPGNQDWKALQDWINAGNKPEEPTANLAILQEQKHTQNEAESARRLQSLVSRYSPEERETWWLLAADVDGFLADNDLTKYPALRAEAIARSGAATESAIRDAAVELAQTVVQKRDALRTASAVIRGSRSRIANQIDAANTVKKLNAIKLANLWNTLAGDE